MLAILTTLLFAGNKVGRIIFARDGEPLSVPEFYVSALIGIVFFASFAFIVSHLQRMIHRQKFGTEQGGQLGHEMEAITDALSKISRGDFTVILPEMSGRHPLSELTSSINKMARELGSIEQMRQDFVSNVSHEIQSPLTSITGFAELLKDENLPEEKRLHYLEIIETESKRLSSLSENLLKLSSLEMDDAELSRQSFRLDKQIEKAILMLEPQWSGKAINIEASLDEIAYDGDESLLSQVWINLLGNAIKFTPHSGRISISLSETGGGIAIEIADSGIGISPEDQLRIFERFYKVDKARDRSLGGNGLGLSIVKRIIDLHLGQTAVQSVPYKGTKFTITLPV
jgi:signal transduction histidine kinase